MAKSTKQKPKTLRVSLYGHTPEDALKKALSTPPTKAVKKPRKKKG